MLELYFGDFELYIWLLREGSSQNLTISVPIALQRAIWQYVLQSISASRSSGERFCASETFAEERKSLCILLQGSVSSPEYEVAREVGRYPSSSKSVSLKTTE
jgi:hypothetical protein